MTRHHLTRRNVLASAGLILAAATLTACGRKADPERPEDADPAAPRRYPVLNRGQPTQRDTEPTEEPRQSSPFLYR